jgi:sialidase-1
VILFSNAASLTRERMTVRASFDDGRTWPVARTLGPWPAAYSCLAALPDGSAGLLYETGPEHPYQAIVFAGFGLDWLAAAAGENEAVAKDRRVWDNGTAAPPAEGSAARPASRPHHR